MLLEDEKEAIEILENEKSNLYVLTQTKFTTCTVEQAKAKREAINTVLNLITKLQKEIEHQKEKRKNQKTELAILNEKQKEMNKLINDVKSYKGQFKRQEKEIQKYKYLY